MVNRCLLEAPSRTPVFTGCSDTTVMECAKNFGYTTLGHHEPRKSNSHRPHPRKWARRYINSRRASGQLPPVKVALICAHRLKGKVGTLSRCKYGFDSRWVYHMRAWCNGSHAALRMPCRKACRFKSCRSHQMLSRHIFTNCGGSVPNVCASQRYANVWSDVVLQPLYMRE